MSSTSAAIGAQSSGGVRAVTAAVIGNVLEWYDFSVYGFLATIVAQQFFPSSNEVASLLATFAAFGLGFLARPLGGIVIGRMADTRGRKPALMLTLFLMAVGTVGVGLIPGAATIGIAAPILLVLCRMLQGFSAGGEWGGSTAFIVEWAPDGRRGYYGSFQQASVAGGLLLGSAVAALCSTLIPAEAMTAWGWRVPFLLGGLLIPVGLYMRANIDDSPAFRAAQAAPKRSEGPSDAMLGVQAFGFTILWTVAYYLMLSYMPTFTQRYAGLGRTEALWSNTIGLVVLLLAIPAMGALSDRIGRKPLLLACCAGFAILSWPLFSLMVGGGGFTTVLIVQLIFGLLIASFSGPGPAAIAEIFPTASRSTWMSTGYSLSVAIFGGFAPFIATWLIGATGSPLSPTWYVAAAAVVSFLVIWRLRETAFARLA